MGEAPFLISDARRTLSNAFHRCVVCIYVTPGRSHLSHSSLSRTLACTILYITRQITLDAHRFHYIDACARVARGPHHHGMEEDAFSSYANGESTFSLSIHVRAAPRFNALQAHKAFDGWRISALRASGKSCLPLYI